jgi:hypothetical protein
MEQRFSRYNPGQNKKYWDRKDNDSWEFMELRAKKKEIDFK